MQKGLHFSELDVEINKQQSLIQQKKSLFYLVISKFYLIRKFINILKYLTSKRTPKYLSKYHFEMINDKSFSYEEHITKQENNPSLSLSQSKKTTIYSIKFLIYLKKLGSYLDKTIPIFDF